MGGLTLPDFPAHESQALLTSMQAYFAEDGISLHADQPGRWLACGQVFQDLSTASLERVAGRDVAPWLPHTRSAIPLQRLQSEMQMLLYQHPVNDARAARGVPSVNSFWVSGTGDLPELLPTVAEAAAPVVVTSLRDAALDEDWPAWVQAWHALDGNECKTLLAALERGEDCHLTLCGERSARRFSRQRTPLLTRITSLFDAQRPSSMLEQL
jgi:hypothetical protein